MVTGANVHDVTQIETVLDAMVIKRPNPKQRRHKHLCADAGYRGKKALKVILAHGYIPHMVSRKREADQKKKDPKKKARRWVVEACHGLQHPITRCVAVGIVDLFEVVDVHQQGAQR